MPKVYEYRGINFYIFPGDHDPPHVHVMKDGEYRISMAIDGNTYKVLWKNKTVSVSTINMLRRIITKKKILFTSHWAIYGDNE